MILTCPACSARYLIAADAIGEAGRSVRCGKCGHNWQQEPVHDSLDELSEQGADAFLGQDHNDEPTRTDDADSVEAALQSFMNDTIPEGVRPLPPEPQIKRVSPTENKSRKFRLPARLSGNLPVLTGVLAAILVFALVFTGFIAARATVMGYLPFTKPVFVAMGLEETGHSETLVFDSVSATIEGSALHVTGNLINLSASTMTLPPMVVEILDTAGKSVAVLPADLPRKTVEGEQSLSIELSFKDIPENATQARLKFENGAAEPSAEAAHEEAAPATAAPTTGAADADSTHAPPEAASDPQTAHE